MEDFLKEHQFKSLTEKLKNPFIRAHVLSAITGNIDLHDGNLLLVDDVKLVPIDFRKSFSDLTPEKSLAYDIFNWAAMRNKPEVTKKSLFDALKKSIGEYERRQDEVDSVIVDTCKKLHAEDQVDRIKASVRANVKFLKKQVEIYTSPVVVGFEDAVERGEEPKQIQVIKSLRPLQEKLNLSNPEIQHYASSLVPNLVSIKKSREGSDQALTLPSTPSAGARPASPSSEEGKEPSTPSTGTPPASPSSEAGGRFFTGRSKTWCCRLFCR